MPPHSPLPSSPGAAGLPPDRPWSFSLLDAYELCPKKYDAEKRSKTVAELSNEKQQYGTYAHKCFELRMRRGAKLPLDMTHHEPMLQQLCDYPGEKLTEQRMALTRDLKPTGFFDSDVWVRGLADLLIVNEKQHKLVAVDYKFGRMKDSFDQLDLMVAIAFRLVKGLKHALGLFYWAGDKKFTRKLYDEDSTLRVWENIMPRVQQFQEAHRTGTFPARPNFLCRKHCPVTGCKYHKVGGR